MWKETFVKYYPGIFLKGLRKATEISVRIVSVLAEIQTRYHPECNSEVLSLEPTWPSFLFHEYILFAKTRVYVCACVPCIQASHCSVCFPLCKLFKTECESGCKLIDVNCKLYTEYTKIDTLTLQITLSAIFMQQAIKF
jgi:hypothetical protein